MVADSRCPRHAQVGRESIPLFVRESYLVTDSVSLDRQSLNSVEPFRTGTSSSGSTPPHPQGRHGVAAAMLASTRAPLGTLQEEESFEGELPALDLAHPGSLTPAALQKAAARAARAAATSGFGDQQLKELPMHLPDPESLSTGGAMAMDITPARPLPRTPGACNTLLPVVLGTSCIGT